MLGKVRRASFMKRDFSFKSGPQWREKGVLLALITVQSSIITFNIHEEFKNHFFPISHSVQMATDHDLFSTSFHLNQVGNSPRLREQIGCRNPN